jgi:hypothetical protein
MSYLHESKTNETNQHITIYNEAGYYTGHGCHSRKLLTGMFQQIYIQVNTGILC